MRWSVEGAYLARVEDEIVTWGAIAGHECKAKSVQCVVRRH
jgi:hypothetical protein